MAASKPRAANGRVASGRHAVAASLRRAREVELGSSAIVLAAQQLTCTIPLVLVLAALRPASTSASFGSQLGRYLGLTPRARAELTAVFAGPAQIRSAATAIGVLLLFVFTIGVAQAHQHAYELAWRINRPPPGTWHRQIRWVAALAGYIAVLAAIAHTLGGLAAQRPAFIAASAPISTLFYWWSQRTLLARRVPSRALVPGAALTALGVTLLLVVLPPLVSEQITSSVHQFGPIGVTFVLATWQLAISIVVVAGATAGAALHERHHRQRGQNAP